MLARHDGKTYKENLAFKKYNVSQDTYKRHVHKTCRKYMSTRHQPYLADMSCGVLVSCQHYLAVIVSCQHFWCLVNTVGLPMDQTCIVMGV